MRLMPAGPAVARLSGLFGGSGLRARSLRASALVVCAFGLQRVLQLASNLILTRILFPDAFGLMALVGVFIAGIGLMSDVGITASLIRSRRSDEAVFQSTSWTLQAVRGLWITVVAWLLAWPYAQIYDEPLLFPLICVSAVGTAITGFTSIGMTLREREMVLGRVLTLEIGNQAVGLVVTVLLAWLLQSVWGLAIGGVVAAVFSTTLSHVLFPSPNHRFSWDRSVLTEIVHFGRWILIGTLFTYLSSRGIQAIRGYYVDLDTLAFFHIAGMFAWMIGDLAQMVLGKVAFPALSQVARERPQDIGRITFRIHGLQAMATVPGFILLAFLAEPLIDLLYDDRYAPAGRFLALLSLSGAFGVLPMVYQNAMLALGDSRSHAMIMGVAAALKIAGTVVGFFLGGAMGMVVGLVIATLVIYLSALAVAARQGFAAYLIDAASVTAILTAFAVIWFGMS